MKLKGYLEQHGKQYRVQVWVPKALQEVYGKKLVKVPLHTSSKADANRLKIEVLARLHREFREAEKALGKMPSARDKLNTEAMDWRATLASEVPIPYSFVDTSGDLIEAEEHIVRDDLLPERAREIEATHGTDIAKVFVQIATGENTPVRTLVDLWLSEAGIKERQKKEYRRAVERFHEWLTAPQGERPRTGLESGGGIEAVTRKVAGRFISDTIVGKGVHPKTGNKTISCLSSYWRWLLKRGHVTENPWTGQSLSRKLAPKVTKRPYTDEEVIKLLTSTKNTFLLDIIKVAALSGMRREEIMGLTVKDCRDGVFNVAKSKTDAGVRTFPIHSGLQEIVARRVKVACPQSVKDGWTGVLRGKDADDWLFDEYNDQGTERGDYAGKKFNDYRRSIGIDERQEGQRQSNLDLHSLRRWFILKATEALRQGASGYDQWTVAEVVGHDTKSSSRELNMTMGVYAGKQSMDAKRACVEAVRLP